MPADLWRVLLWYFGIHVALPLVRRRDLIVGRALWYLSFMLVSYLKLSRLLEYNWMLDLHQHHSFFSGWRMSWKNIYIKKKFILPLNYHFRKKKIPFFSLSHKINKTFFFYFCQKKLKRHSKFTKSSKEGKHIWFRQFTFILFSPKSSKNKIWGRI